MKVQKIKLPGRGIYKLEDPSLEEVEAIGKNNIVKVIITDKKIDIDELKEKLQLMAPLRGK